MTAKEYEALSLKHSQLARLYTQLAHNAALEESLGAAAVRLVDVRAKRERLLAAVGALETVRAQNV